MLKFYKKDVMMKQITKNKRIKYTDGFKKEVINYFANDQKVVDILKKYNIHESTIHKWILWYKILDHLKLMIKRI